MSIELKHVSASYGDTKVLQDISVVFEDTKKICILGENGSGKTTLLRCMAGLMPYEGEILIDGENITSIKRKELSKRLAMLNQFSSAYFSYTVQETVMLGRYSHINGFLAGPSKEDLEKVEESLKRFGLEEKRNQRIDALSGGQLQRVFLAQTFAQEAKYLLLDEPMNHLDLRYRAELEEELKNYPGMVAAVFHDVPTALSMAEEVILLKEGRITYAGSPEELLEGSALTDAFHIDVQAYFSRMKL